VDISIGYKKRKAAENQDPGQPDLPPAALENEAGATGPGMAGAGSDCGTEKYEETAPENILPDDATITELPAEETTETRAATQEGAEDATAGASAEEPGQVPAVCSEQEEKAEQVQLEEEAVPELPAQPAEPQDAAKPATGKTPDRANDRLLLFLLVLLLLLDTPRQGTD